MGTESHEQGYRCWTRYGHELLLRDVLRGFGAFNEQSSCCSSVQLKQKMSVKEQIFPCDRKMVTGTERGGELENTCCSSPELI